MRRASDLPFTNIRVMNMNALFRNYNLNWKLGDFWCQNLQVVTRDEEPLVNGAINRSSGLRRSLYNSLVSRAIIANTTCSTYGRDINSVNLIRRVLNSSVDTKSQMINSSTSTDKLHTLTLRYPSYRRSQRWETSRPHECQERHQ